MNQLFPKLRFINAYILTFFHRQSSNLKNPKQIFAVFFLLIFLITVIIVIKQNSFQKAYLIEGIVGTFRQEDLPESVTNLLSSSLIAVDKTGQPQGELVESWAVSEDAKIFTFKLKDNLVWTNGEKIKASDIDLQILDVEMQAIDERTLQFKLADAFSPFPTLLVKPVFKKGSRIGTGPYKINKIQKDQIFVKRLVLNSSDRALPEIVIRFYPSERIAKDALKLGEVQSLLGVNDLKDLQNQVNLTTLSKTNYNQIVTIFYNTKDPILSDENLRLALSYSSPAIPQEKEANTSLPANNWAFNSDVKNYLDNEEQAKLSLKKVQNVEKLKQSKDPVVTLTATSSLEPIGQMVVDSWNKLGIKTVLRVESGIPQNFQALLIAQNIPSDPDQYSLWHSTQAQTNISQFSNPRIDKDLEDARKTNDLKVRLNRYQDFQKTLLDHAPATFLYFPKYNLVYMKKIEPQFQKVTSMQLNFN